MDVLELRALLEAVRAGTAPVDGALKRLADEPLQRERLGEANLGFAVVDTARASRQGQPEVVFGEGKSVAQIAGIANVLRGRGDTVLVTRVDPAKAAGILEAVPTLTYHAQARVLVELGANRREIPGNVAILAAGTSDMFVAEECAETLHAFGIAFDRIYDVGVAGLHRLLHRVEDLRSKDALIVVAGMEGALPSVVGGLVDVPIIAVPTSVGYGAAFGGIAALCGMLTSCASGVTVTNIDNGFGAAFAVARMLRASARGAEGRV
jgi:hypothetical protein